MSEMLKKIVSDAKACGVTECGWIDTQTLTFHENIRRLCEGNQCRSYGKTWACPPAVGTLDECRVRCLRYSRMLLFSRKYDLEDSFDLEGMQAGHRAFKSLSDALYEKIKPYLSDFLLLSNEGCARCATCTYPAAPCRFPERLFHSLEGYGFIVSDLCKMTGIRYINGQNTVTYFGALLI